MILGAFLRNALNVKVISKKEEENENGKTFKESCFYSMFNRYGCYMYGIHSS